MDVIIQKSQKLTPRFSPEVKVIVPNLGFTRDFPKASNSSNYCQQSKSLCEPKEQARTWLFGGSMGVVPQILQDALGALFFLLMFWGASYLFLLLG